MARDFELDLSRLTRLIDRAPEVAKQGAKRGLGDIKDDWVRGARNIAPLDTGNLRRQIHGEVEDLNVIVTANATSRHGGGTFNYAYYIHEEDAGGKQLRHPGTVKKFLDESQREDAWERILEREIEQQLRREGW